MRPTTVRPSVVLVDDREVLTPTATSRSKRRSEVEERPLGSRGPPPCLAPAARDGEALYNQRARHLELVGVVGEDALDVVRIPIAPKRFGPRSIDHICLSKR
jgi:hypothetical protein